MRPAGHLAAPPSFVSPLGKLLAEAPTRKPPAMGELGGAWALIVLGALSLSGAGLAFLGEAPVGAVLTLAVLGAAVFAPGVVLLQRRTGQRGELRVFERGFSVKNAGGAAVEATYEELEGLALDEKELLQNGESKGYVRILTLWAKGQRVSLRSHIDGEGDAFGGALAALIDGELEQTLKGIAGGGTLRGEGWQLDRLGLKVGNGAATSLERFVATGVNEGRAQAWRRGEEEPSFSVPIGSKNARTALGVIARHLPEDDAAGEVPGLGRRLFRKGMSRAQRITWYSLGALFALPSLLVILAGEVAGGLIGLGIGGGLLLLGASGEKSGTNIHQRGVRQRGLLGGIKELRFEDVAAYTHATTRHYYNGAYTGTVHGLEFVPVAGKGKKIKVHHIARGNDEDMERLRGAMAQIVAGFLHTRLQAGERIAWAGAELSREGVHFHQPKLIGKGPPALLRYAGSRYAFNQGVLMLYAPTGDKHVTAVTCSGFNFYPGFELYQRMCAAAQVSGPIQPLDGVIRPS